MVAEIISPAVLYPLSLAKLLNSAPILHLTPEDLANYAKSDEVPIGYDKEGEDRISEMTQMSIDAPRSVDNCVGDTMSGWETSSAVTSSSMLSISDDNVHFPDQTDMVNDEVPASLSSRKPILSYLWDGSECALLSPQKVASRSSI